MEYKKKMKMRMCVSLIYFLIGAALIVLKFINIIQADFIASLGPAFVVIGLVQFVRNIRLLRNADAMKRREVSERDERNIMIYEKARSLTFAVFCICAGAAVIILSCMGQDFAAKIIAYTLCGFTLVYWICYIIMSKKY